MDSGDEVVTVAVTEPVSFNNTWKAVITLGTFLFNGAIIVFSLWRGDPANSLHTSAQSWAFTTSLVILAGLGIGAFTPAIIDAFTKK